MCCRMKSLIDDRNNLRWDWELRMLQRARVEVMAKHIKGDWVKRLWHRLRFFLSLLCNKTTNNKQTDHIEAAAARHIELGEEEISLNEFVFNVEVEVE